MPFVIKYPGVIKPKTVNDDIITNIDFAPTILEMLELNLQIVFKEKFLNLISKKSKDWRQSMYYHYYEYPFIITFNLIME